MRINKFIALATGCSRRKAEGLVSSGHIKINDRTIYNLATRVDIKNDKVKLHNKTLQLNKYVYYALNKPIGFASTRQDPFATKKVVDLVPQNPPVVPVGRLDKNSEGLMLLTNDGDFANDISHPSTHIEKEYFIIAHAAKKEWDAREFRKFKSGINIGGYKTQPAEVFGWTHNVHRVTFHIVLEEGKKRQIRRMCQKIGLEVQVLKRVRIGRLKLGDLKPGDYRKVTPDDVLENR